MIEYGKEELLKLGDKDLARRMSAIHTKFRQRHPDMGDIPLPQTRANGQESSAQTPTQVLRRAIQELKTSPNRPELVTAYWRAKMAVDGKRAGVDISVADCDRTAEEIAELREKGRTLVYLHPELATQKGLVTLGRMYPGMQSWATREGTTIVSESNSGGWLDIESALESPNLGTREQQAMDIFKSQGLGGQRLSTYVLGSQASRDLTGHYFDESSWSRVSGSRYGSRVVYASFFPDGSLDVSSDLLPDRRYPDLGARSEGVKSA